MPFLPPVPGKSTPTALPHPPSLGFPVPSHRHAVSVQLPTWQDMRGMVAQDPRVTGVQQIGYPRSFLHTDVVKVNTACLALFGQQDEKCLIFPSLNHALACHRTIIDLEPEAAGSVRVTTAAFVLDEPTDAGQPRSFFITFFPAQFIASAMIFWRLTGTGILSRLAQSMHQHLDSIYAQSTDSIIEDHSDSVNEIVDTKADALVRLRIANLLKRASINPLQSEQFTSSDIFLYPTGMAAIYSTNELLLRWRLASTVVFGFPYELTLELVEKYGLGCKFYGLGSEDELESFEAYLSEEYQHGRTIQSVWCECASNPLLRTVDLQRIRQLADIYGFVVVIDETISSFANVDVAGIADVIVTSLTKSFSGKAIIPLPRGAEEWPRLDSMYVNELFAADARVLEQNSREFLARAAIMNRNAQHLVSVLLPFAKSPSSSLTHIYYSSTCWSRRNYEARMRADTVDFTPGYGCLFTLEFESVVTAATFFDAMNVHKGPSSGASVTLAQPYVQTVFSREKEWATSYGLSTTMFEAQHTLTASVGSRSQLVVHPLANIPQGKLESLNALQRQFDNDTRFHKSDLMRGVYQTKDGYPYVFPSVKMARQMLFDDPEWEHEYPPSHLGEVEFRDWSARLLFGDESQTVREKRLASMQALGGSGACHMGARFLRRHYEPYESDPERNAYIPAESWGEPCRGLRDLQTCAVVSEFLLLVAATYGKALGLYGERVGYLCVSLPTAEAAARSEQQMKLLARAETGAQPRFGARLVSNILGNPRLKIQWEEDIKRLAEDLADRRKKLKVELLRGNSHDEWDFVTRQAGMFL
ncbi:cystathionine gamma-synthase [Aspergillus affinis]|uniref:cystathionine gamma-synthase n=1 Tax=Aspergillus affinis TaxID=1070780 RepID=UPI0022FE4864|nr:cystathionine gamma-synthase [Aspergillus affinis]KAI9039798.1 cystathionine gamma-synthase [Aspergillus affinis]